MANIYPWPNKHIIKIFLLLLSALRGLDEITILEDTPFSCYNIFVPVLRYTVLLLQDFVLYEFCCSVARLTNRKVAVYWDFLNASGRSSAFQSFCFIRSFSHPVSIAIYSFLEL